VLGLDLHQLADPCPGCRQIPDDEIPFHVAIFFERVLEEAVIGVADNVLQEAFLLYLDELELPFVFVQERKVFVDCLNPQVYGLRLEPLQQVSLVRQQVFHVHAVVVGKIVVYRPHIRGDGVSRKAALSEMRFKLFSHSNLHDLFSRHIPLNHFIMKAQLNLS